MADSIDIGSLEFTVEATSADASKNLDSLADSLKRLRDSAKGLSLKSVGTNLTTIGAASKDINSNALLNLATALNNLKSVKVSSTIAKNIAAIGTSVRGISDSDIQRLERMGNALRGLGSVGKISIPKVVTKDVSTGKELDKGTTSVSGGSAESEAQKVSFLAQAMDSAKQAGRGLGSVIRGAAEDIRSLGLVSASSAKSLWSVSKYTAALPLTLGSQFAGRVKEATAALGHMFSRIKRIALYRLIRSVIREITQGLKEGIQNIYAYSRALNGEFATAMDNLASSSLYLKNSLGAMAAPILQSLIPAINFAIDRLVTLMNLINQFISALGGKATYTAAKRMETSFASAASGAAGAAKKAVDKIKSYTIGIDELNILEPDKGSGSGGGGSGGGAGGLNTADMFEEVE